MANLAYVRVSTANQNEGRQIEGLKQYQIDRWFTDQVSGKDTRRPQLQALLDYAREGDTVYVHDFSRLARNTRDLLELTEHFREKNIGFVSCKEQIDTSTPAGQLMLTMIAAIAEFERQSLLERQREGIKLAKEAGRYRGRKEKVISDQSFEKVYIEYIGRKITKKEMARQLNISRPTLDKLIRIWEESGTLKGR